ncbi:MAG: hypothetical protein M0P12_00875 [Paludibacteraceae bacterium]|nr:hypothetical protein [Paludibacteraceae bacterium]
MWICSKFGFYSIVFKEGSYQVRAREKKDLVNLITVCGFHGKEICEFKMSDYQYRVLIDKNELFTVMEILGDSIDYSNFKSMIDHRPDQKNKPYHRIWNVLAEALGCYGEYLDKHQNNTKKPKYRREFFWGGGV